MKSTFAATFVDSDLPAQFAGKVLSVHGRAINILLDNGELATVVRAALGPGPNRIGIAFREPAGSFPAWGLTAGDPVARTDNAVDLGENIFLDLTTSMHSSSLVAAGSFEPTHFSNNRKMVVPLLAATPDGGPSGDEFLRRSAAFADILQGGDSHALAAAVRSLMGLGPGLTPSGDDFLVGLLCGWRVAGFDGPVVGAVREATLASLDATGLTSGHYLKHACRGRFAAVLVAVAAGLARGNPATTLNAARWCLQFGATSGYDSLRGILCALDFRHAGIDEKGKEGETTLEKPRE